MASPWPLGFAFLLGWGRCSACFSCVNTECAYSSLQSMFCFDRTDIIATMVGSSPRSGYLSFSSPAPWNLSGLSSAPIHRGVSRRTGGGMVSASPYASATNVQNVTVLRQHSNAARSISVAVTVHAAHVHSTTALR